MAIIGCGRNEDEKFVPLTVEFEPGDVLRIEGDKESRSIEVQRSVNLEDMSEYIQQLLTWLNENKDGGALGGDEPRPKLPPPPPEDGALKLKHKEGGHKGIKLTFDQ